jgi:hypothetical protein
MAWWCRTWINANDETPDLSAAPDGATEAIMRAHGFTTEQMVDLVRAGLATANTERVVAGRRKVELVRMRITEAGRRAVADSSKS